jgi:hypothetical protein
MVRGVDSLLPAEAASTKTAITLSAGVATVSLPARNFRAVDLLIGAERCLHGAQICGGNSPKSISVYKQSARGSPILRRRSLLQFP